VTGDLPSAGAVPRPLPELPADLHKGRAGRCLCVCGSAEMPGASILAVRAAHRAGAGRVTLACLDRELLGTVPIASPETVLWNTGAAAAFPEPARSLEALAASQEFHARLAGPGLGLGERTRAWVDALLGLDDGAPLVLDADALSALAGAPPTGRTSRAPLVLTPHAGEAAALLGRPVPGDPDGRLASARELAARHGAIAVLKGAGTVVTDGERAFVNPTGNPGMATAGAGDVLSGILVAYLAASRTLGGDPGSGRSAFGAFDAAVAAVYAHGLAGDLAARALGARAVTASDLITHLPRAQRRLG